jgi:hypothetical protein
VAGSGKFTGSGYFVTRLTSMVGEKAKKFMVLFRYFALGFLTMLLLLCVVTFILVDAEENQ